MRLPLAQPLTTRDGSLNKDSKVVNGYVETKGDQAAVFKRPGTTNFVTLTPGQGQGMIYWKNQIRAAIAGTLYNIAQGVTGVWNTMTTSSSLHSNRGAWNGTVFCILNGSGTTAATSPDGITWSNRTLPSNSPWSSVAWNGTVFCAIAASTTAAATSPDGITWTARTMPSGASWSDIEWNGTVFCAVSVGTSAATSPDGITWTARTLPASERWIKIAWNGSVFCAVTDDTKNCATSPDGVTWFYHLSVVAGIQSGAIASNGSIFVSLTANGIVTSPDGVGWTLRSSPTTGYTQVSWNGTCFLAVKPGTAAALSVDGITWSATTNAASFTTPRAIIGKTNFFVCIQDSSAGSYVTTSAVSYSGSGTTIPAASTTEQYQFIPAGSAATNQYLMIKTSGSAAYYDGTTLTQITDADYPLLTVPGAVFLDGYFFVMDPQARIWNSDLNNMTSWTALGFVTAAIEPGNGVAIAKSQNYVVAFKEWSTEFFFDNANPPPGSPISPVLTNFTLVGCASGASVAQVDKYTFWLAQTRQRGRQAYMMVGDQQQPISTPDVERVLGRDNLATVYSLGLRIDGHAFYVLSLVTSNVTLVYDVDSQQWYTWSSLTAASSKSVSSITRSGTTATVTTTTAHGLSDGDPVLIAGANQSAYNGIFQTRYVSTTVYTIEVTGSPTTPATGTITSTGYTETYFKYCAYALGPNVDLIQHVSDGNVYQLSKSYYQDNGVPIDLLIRTGKFDGGSTSPKLEGRCEIIGNKIVDTAMIRHSDDDYQTNSAYRIVNLNAERSQIWRQGRFRRRSYEFRYIGNNQLQVANLELDLE